ncbi:ABC transporter permease [Neisseria dumasiana]|uniref:Transport permease protein n=1 Tax=Neisseria dumasiana TaxID=1931275 RepID=A0ABX3WIL0_9NEIS|nr:ABC transporter permease [Neisseria dumasiana]OSI27926.1 sugar ABC transporter permease [Neisseria dumasiana]UOO84744.1 ABC transporter permease [Neisseria dumasiana]
MKALHETSFRESLVIQLRVIGALLMREIITRYGRNNIGFLWLFVEPLLMTLLIVIAWKFLKADHLSSLNIVAFVLTGYPMAMMWRNASSRSIGAISANATLLYHRNVKILDTIFARVLLEVAGATVAQIAIMVVLVTLRWVAVPNDIFYMFLAWVLMGLFALSLGLIVCSIAFKFEVFGKLWSTLSLIMLPISGAFFFLSSLPYQIQSYFKWIPMVHGTEMFRQGYFGSAANTLENPWYLLLCNLVMLWIGLAMVAKFSKGVEPQ